MGRAALSREALVACVWVALAAASPATAETPQLTTPRSSVVVVLDASKTLSGKKLTSAKRALATGRRALPDGTPVTVSVGRGASCLRPPAGEAASANTTVVLVAAGPDHCRTPPPCRQATAGSETPPARVDAIGMAVDPAARRGLQCAAQSTSGVYRDVTDPDALAPELRTMLARATRDRRRLGRELAGGLKQSDATPAKPGEYTDAIDPDSDRWYTIDVPIHDTLSVAATVAAPPTGDVSAVGSSLELQLLDPGLKVARSATSTNLFSFQPDRNLTLNSSLPGARAGSYRVHVALRDSPDKQLATKLGGRPLPLELVFQLTAPQVMPPPPARSTTAKAAEVSWPAAAGAALGCALLVLAAVALAPRRKVRSAEEES